MAIGPCRLCGREAELLFSHMIPAFVFRWVRESSGGGYLRFAQEPNKRVQDGLQLELLCGECEGRIGRFEDQFARRLFYPYVADGGLRVRYGPWLLKFAASLVWRVLVVTQEKRGLAGFPSE